MEYRNHHFGGLIEMIFGDCGDDLVAFMTPAKRGWTHGEEYEEGGNELLEHCSRIIIATVPEF
jgi:hypothetical protein